VIRSQQVFSQPQAFSQQAGLAQQAGSGQQPFTGPQVSHAQQRLHAHRSFRPANRSLIGVARGQQVLSQPQAFSQQAGFAQQAGSGAQQSPLNPRLQRATLNSSAPNKILVLIEQQLLYNELVMLLPLAAISNAECPCRGAIRRARRVLPWVRTDSGVFAGRQLVGKAGKLHQFARFRRQKPSSHSMARNAPDWVPDAPSQRATAARAIR